MSRSVSILSNMLINSASMRLFDSPKKNITRNRVSRHSKNVNIRSQFSTTVSPPESIAISKSQNGVIPHVQKNVAPDVISPPKSTLGNYIARRLIQIGVTDVFCVPGDSNLTLLDYFVAEPGLNLIGCCNELNAGYAADGYARSRGIGVCVVTFTVGGLSVLNAIAGAFSEDLPVICIVGGPNSNDHGTNKILHHTIGLPDFSQELKCFENVTCFQGVVNSLEDAHEHVDSAIRAALEKRKPVYLNISCNLVSIPHPTFRHNPIPISVFPTLSNKLALDAAVEVAAEFLNKATKPVLVGGPKMRASMASDAFVELADKSGYPVALFPSAKGLFPEGHPNFIGTYWGSASSACCAEIVESADAYLFAGSVFDVISSVGYSLLVKKQKAIIVGPDRVTLGNGQSFGCVAMNDFLRALSNRIKSNGTALHNYRRIFVSEEKPLELEQKVPLRVNVLFRYIQNMLRGGNVVIAEAGDSWFNSQTLKLPTGCGYESQMLYASIGWSVGATLGYAQASPDKRVIALIGDGSFQMTVQDVSTMLRCGHKSVIFLLNNGGYTTEVVIHDGPYNEIKNWNYTALIDAIDNKEGKCWTTKVICEEELMEAIEIAKGAKKDCLCFVEVVLDKHDTSRELLEFGCRLAATNSRPPNV